MAIAVGIGGCSARQGDDPRHLVIPQASELQLVADSTPAVYLPTIERSAPPLHTGSRGYLTTPGELATIAEKAQKGIEPYASAVEDVLEWAEKPWNYKLDRTEKCSSSDKPRWNDDQRGTPELYARALAYHLTGDEKYAKEVRQILEQIMSKIEVIDLEEQQCRLNFGWGTPELVASADLIEDFWRDQTCEGPLSTVYGNTELGEGPCKELFQNWLVKNPYYVVSYAAAGSASNWGAAATNATAYIADYLWDRPDVTLLHRHPPQMNEGKDLALTPAEAYAYTNQLMLDRMNGYHVEYTSSSSCDRMEGPQQGEAWKPVKTQISEAGIIPEDARREQHCNVPVYNGEYQNYPQIHLGNNIQQCELMLRRGDRSCYDNVDMTALPDYTFVDPKGEAQVTSLNPGRGSIERAINAVIVDSGTPWEHESALEVAYRYYVNHHRLDGVEAWAVHLDPRPSGCSQNICFGTLTHGFAPGEVPELPPTAPPP